MKILGGRHRREGHGDRAVHHAYDGSVWFEDKEAVLAAYGFPKQVGLGDPDQFSKAAADVGIGALIAILRYCSPVLTMRASGFTPPSLK